MTVNMWDVDQAVARESLDQELEGCSSVDRYGVTGSEEMAGEPLAVALAQEETERTPHIGIDDQWIFVDEEDFRRSLVALTALEGEGPEADALHVVTL